LPNLLKQLQLEELSLVDRPANPLAMAPLYKRDTSQGEDMTDKTQVKDDEAVEALKSEVTELTEKSDKLKAENERLRKSLIEDGYSITAESIEKKAPEEFIEYDGEKINKSDVPAPILKALEQANADKADTALTKRAEAELPNFSVEVAKSLLTAVSKMDDMEILMEALKAADVTLGQKMEEFGKSDVNGDFDSAEAKLEALAKAHASDKKVSYAKAYAAVIKTDDGKALVKEVYKKG
jgi:hypothetical protein